MTDLLAELRALGRLDPQTLAETIDALPPEAITALLSETATSGVLPAGPAEQAVELDERFVMRSHLQYASQRIAAALRDVENGTSRKMIVSMPPRAGKSTLCSYYAPLWIQRQHPEWDFAIVSHEDTLAQDWSKAIRTTIEQHGPSLGLALSDDAGAVNRWETSAGGRMLARTWRGSLTGRGAKVMIIDDVVKDFVEAHSATTREAIWRWWLTVAQTRLDPSGSLVIVVMTRWHEDDFAGRLLSSEYDGDPSDWEVVEFPAIAESDDDALGRHVGEPLLSPLVDEDSDAAIERWESTRRAIGTYAFSAMYQQHPAPAEGIIFDPGWWRFYTSDPELVSEKCILLDRSELIGAPGTRWLDSWDCAFKATDGSDYVVAQRWCRKGADRFLIAQVRERMTFTQTAERMEQWSTNSPLAPIGGSVTHEHLVEDKANGTAVIDVLRKKISGLIAVNPTESKEARARAVTPEVESGNVYLPHPAEPGNEWVADLLDETRNFPRGSHDDQVDALSQALYRLRDAGIGSIANPAKRAQSRRPSRQRSTPAGPAAALVRRRA